MDQLLYGSADGIAGRAAGGWGVVHETSGLDARVREKLSSLASVYLPQTMPQFPSAEQLAGRVKRFRARPFNEGLGVCMSVEAGPDHTGRPGNVISHCAQVPYGTGLRPVDWFFSNGWVLPFGAQKVASATLDDELPPPKGWPAVANWLRENHERIQTARWLVSAGVRILQERMQLIVVAPSPEEGARWVSVITWMLPPAIAESFPHLIGEDARSMGENAKEKYIAVIGPDVAVPESMSALVVDVTGEGAEEGPWGQIIADLLLQPDEVAADVFARRDELLVRYRNENLQEPFRIADALKVAWLTREGGQNFGQESSISELLDAVGPTIRQWPELQQLATFLESHDKAPEVVASPNSEELYGEFDDFDEPYDSVDEPYLGTVPPSAGTPPIPAPVVPSRPRAAQPSAESFYGQPQPRQGYSPSPAQASVPPPDGGLPAVPGEIVVRGLEAAARIGSLDIFANDDWASQLAYLNKDGQRDVWAIAAALPSFAPRPEKLTEALHHTLDLASIRAAVTAVAQRSEAKHGASVSVQNMLGGQAWQ